MAYPESLNAFTFDAAVAAGLEAHHRLDHATARCCFDRAAALKRTQFVVSMLAVSENRLGDLDASRRLYREALTLPGDGDYAKTGLMAVLSASGDPFEALPLASQVLARRPDDRVALITVHTVVREAKRQLETKIPRGASLAPVDALLRLLQDRISRQERPQTRRSYQSVTLYERALASLQDTGGQPEPVTAAQSPADLSRTDRPDQHPLNPTVPVHGLAPYEPTYRRPARSRGWRSTTPAP